MANLCRVSILGTMPNGEVWSVNPVFNMTDTSPVVTPEQANAAAVAIANLSAGVGLYALMSTSTFHTGARVEFRTLTGTLETQGEATRAAPQAGNGSAAHPFQTSMVFSLRTNNPGARGRGRLYWPATGVAMSATTLRPTTAVVSTALSSMRTFLTGIGAAITTAVPGSPAVLCVWSRSSLTLPFVRTVQAGDVLDVQRRRRDSLVETYSSVPYPS